MIPIKYNIRNLFVRWFTTLLTAVGFTLVVGLLVMMLSFVEGLNDLSKRSGPEGNVIVLRDGAVDELFSDLVIDANLSTLWNQAEVLRVDPRNPESDRLASKEVYAIATQELPPKQEGGRPEYRFLQVRGVEDPQVAGQVHGLKLKDGGAWFDSSGGEVVLGDGIARILDLKVGDTFEPRPTLNWKVAGILDSRGSPFDSEIWAKDSEVGHYFGKDSETQRFYTSVVLQTKDGAAAAELAKSLQDRTPVRINPVVERKYYEEMSKSNQMFLSAAMFVAIVMAIGGMFGLMNTMFAAVSQRVKDIGVLRIMGYQRWQIMISFLLESLLIALIGGLLGITIGLIFFNGAEQTSIISSGQGGGKTVVFRMIVNQWVLQVAVSFIVTMGLVGGLVPAWTAMRTRPLESLR